MPFSATVAIAALSSRVRTAVHEARPCAAAVAALKVTGPDHALAFSLHTHVPTTSTRLTRWLDALIADDPLLIGYRLPRISRLLAASGYRCDLAGSFSRAGRHEIMHVVRGRPRSLAATAVMSGVMAVDEDALYAARPLQHDVAATLALVNAVASWVVFVRQLPPGQTSAIARRDALNQLSIRLLQDQASTTVIAAMSCPIQ